MTTDKDMDLMTAKVEAAKSSREEKTTIYILVDAEGDCSLSLKNSAMAISAYRNGSEVPLDYRPELELKKSSDPKTNKMKTDKTKPAKKAAKAKEVKPKKWNPEPQFGFSKEGWKKLMAIGTKENVSFVQLMRKTISDKYKID